MITIPLLGPLGAALRSGPPGSGAAAPPEGFAALLGTHSARTALAEGQTPEPGEGTSPDGFGEAPVPAETPVPVVEGDTPPATDAGDEPAVPVPAPVAPALSAAVAMALAAPIRVPVTAAPAVAVEAPA
ncbi:MAG TPA: hypothetical protein VF533_05420, partial [Solirubrobacteraceae bacterium]